MTLPIEKIFSEEPEDFQRDVTEMYKEVAQGINGTIKTYTPTIFGSTSAGAANTYAYQYGLYLRQGLMVDVWVDITWSVAHTGTGTIYVSLPFVVKKTPSGVFPYLGSVDLGGLSYTANYTYAVLLAEPNTTRAHLVQCGSGQSRAGIAIAAAGQIRGHVRYLGQEQEKL